MAALQAFPFTLSLPRSLLSCARWQRGVEIFALSTELSERIYLS